MRRRRNGLGPPARPRPPPAPPPFVPQDVVIDLGSSGEKLTLQTTEAGGFTRNGEAFTSGTAVEAAGNTYRVTLESGTWSAAYEAPNPWAVPLGRSGEALLITRREDGLYEGNGSVFESGGIVVASNGNQYRLTFADGRWASAFLAPEPVPVGLGRSGEVVLVGRTEGGSYQVDGQPVVSGSIVRSSTGAAYRLAMQDGAWRATFEPPEPVVVSVGSGQIVLQLDENGNYRRDGQLFASGTTVEVGGETYQLTLQNGRWTPILQAPVLQMVTLGTSGVTLTLQRSSDGGWTENGEPVRNGDVRRVGNNRYRLLLEDGEWDWEYLRSSIPVDGAGGLIILFQEEDGTLTYNGDPVRDGSVITQDGRTYELLRLSDGTWLATPGAPPPASGDQTVSLPGSGQSVTLTRRDDGSYAYENTAVTDGRVISVGGVDYRLNQNAQGVWSAQRVRDIPDVSTGGVAGPTQTDTVNTFTDTRFDDGDHSNVVAQDGNTYGVQLSIRGEQPGDADDRGTKIVPQRANADHVEFPVYDLMQQSLVHRERTYVEAAKAKLQEIVDIITLNKELYARDARDPDDHIADDGSANTTIGLWRQAELAVGRIFGLTAFSQPDGIFGSDPWSGQTLDLDEVDDVIVALQDAIAALSDVATFEREFEDQIVTINQNGTPDNSADDLNYDAADFFNGLMSRIRFGSTASTRFGAYVVKAEDVDGSTVSDGARGAWVKGVFAYTPSDPPVGTDIPDRGEATYSGSTVVVSPLPTTNPDVEDGNSKGATLLAGKIELDASFTRKNVKGTITELKDESGRTWEHDAGLGRSAVKSIVLPDASLVAGAEGFYASTGTAATATFEDTSRRNATSSSSGNYFRVQLVDNAAEALGVWTAFGLEGAFGTTRTGTVSKPTLPSDTDSIPRGGGANASSIHFITNSTVGSGAGGPISADTEESKFTLTRSQLGIAGETVLNNDERNRVISEDELNRDFTDQLLTDLYRRSRTVRSSTRGFVGEARERINKLRTGLTDSNLSDRATAAGHILNNFLGISKAFDASAGVDGPDNNQTIDAHEHRSALSIQMNSAYSALANATSLHRALTYDDDDDDSKDGFFLNAQNWTLEQTQQVVSEKRWDFRYEFGHNRYTRFGAWAQVAPQTAAANLADPPDSPNHGVFAYSPLRPTVAADVTGLSFIAKYEGRTFAVNESTGNLYRGQFILTVNWENATPSVETTITDLRGVRGTSDYLKWNTRDVKSIFFSGITAAAGTLGGTVAVNFRYKDSSLDTTAADTVSATMSGTFVMDEVFTDEPVGVLGVWSITDTGTTVDDFSGAFGAELKP